MLTAWWRWSETKTVNEYKIMLESENLNEPPKLTNYRIISGYNDCPFNYEYDMAIGYGCKVDTEQRSIKQTKKYQPITPAWYPVKKQEFVVKYGS